MLKLNETEDKEIIIEKTLQIINKYNSIHKSIVKNLEQFENNNIFKNKYYNYYNNFNNKNQNIKKLILYFYNLGLALIKEKTEYNKKTEELLNNFKFQELLLFNMNIKNEYKFTKKEIEKLKMINTYFDELYSLDDNITLKLKEDFINKMKRKEELKEKLRKKIKKSSFIKKEEEIELEKLLNQTLILKNKMEKIHNNQHIVPKKKKPKIITNNKLEKNTEKEKTKKTKTFIEKNKKPQKKNSFSSKNIKLLDVTV